MTVVLIITIFGDVVVVIMMVVFFYLLTIKLWKEIWYGNEIFSIYGHKF